MPAPRRMGRQEISSVLKSGRRARSPHFLIVYNNGISGCAIVVSKKIEKLAVNRNKTKRRIFSILHSIISDDKRYIIFVKAKISAISYNDVQKELKSLIMGI